MRKLGLVFGFCLTQFLCIGQTAQWKIGDTLPNFGYDGQFARDYQLSDLKGSYVLVHYWASWNEESRKMQISFIDLFGRYKERRFKLGRKFNIISIALDDNPEILDLAWQKDNLPWKSKFCDFKGWKSPLIIQSKISQIPANYLLNQNGIIMGVNLKKEQLEEILRSL
jgi:hypothetical protein